MKKILLILSLSIIAFLNCNCQVWHRASGISEQIYSLEVKDDMIFALVNKDGLFSSSDNGMTWNNLGFDFDMSIGRAWGIKPKLQVNNDKIYVGIYTHGLFVSSDDGKSWSEIDLPNNQLLNFIVDGNNVFISLGTKEFISHDNGNTWNEADIDCEECNYYLAMKDSNIYAGNEWGGLYLSSNYGKTWNYINNGLPGSALLSIAINGDTIYLGTERHGIFKSTNKGQNWFDINNGLTYFKVNSIVIDGKNIFAGTDGKAIFLSTDGGGHWNRLNKDYAEDYYNINSIIVLNDFIFVGGNGEILYSSDYGKNWGIINNGVKSSVAFLFSNNDKIIASTSDGLFLSPNHGLSWSHISKDFYEKEPFSTRVSAIISIGDKLFTGVRFRGIYSSTNEGMTWEIQSNGIPQTACIESFAVKDGKIYACLESDGVYMSSDTGRNWYYVNNIFPYSITVYSLAIEDSLIFAGTVDGMYISTDNGVTWSQSGKEIYEKQVYTCLIHDSIIYAGTKDIGIIKSTDKGQNWTQTTIGDLSISSFTACGNTVFAATYGAGCFYTTDSGKIWIQKLKGLKSYDIQSLITIGDTVIAMTETSGLFFTTNNSDSWFFIDKIGGNTLYNYKNAIYIGCFDGVVKSKDFGKNWIVLDSGLYKKDYICFWDDVAIEDSNIFIVDERKNFYHSTNLGNNWSQVNNGIKEYLKEIELYNNILYACTKKGFYKSSDFGHTWKKSDKGLIDTNLGKFDINGDKFLIWSDGKFYLSFDYAENWYQLNDFPPNYNITDYILSNNYILVSTAWEGIIFSSDMGQTWIYGSVNPLYTSYITDIETKDNIVFAGCMFDSMYYSKNYGQSWEVANYGIWDYNYNDVCVNSITISDDNYVYTSPHSNGVYRLSIDDITSIDGKPINLMESFYFSPNPSSDYIFIKCKDVVINQKIKIVDILGNIVWQGIHEGESLRIDISSFPIGVYYVNVGNETKMFVRN
ncbi:MAG: T9SS type A sorting domain-containing protein [Ignavibacteriae bacterium]|nr:T9SS type A sorting domain-containing protein [Ignavibacteriota bacterium]